MRDGIICIDKPAEHTSFDVIARVRGILHMKKVGHAGTLDPMTTGVLPVFLGRATKACDILPVQDKRYRAQVPAGGHHRHPGLHQHRSGAPGGAGEPGGVCCRHPLL